MKPRPKFKLSRLREIGWSRWDPIGLAGLEGAPDDEYDAYLLHAVGRLWDGASEDEVTAYLVAVETEHMGLDDAPNAIERAREAVTELSNYLSELRH